MMQPFRTIFLLFYVFLLTAQVSQAHTWPADTLQQKKVNGVRVKLYKVQAKDSWSSISRKSKVSVAYLMSVNNGVENLKPGQIINIPTEEKKPDAGQEKPVTLPVGADESEPPAPVKESKESKYQEAVYHTVKKGETLFRVSKFYNQSVENIKTWNKLRDNNLKAGQKLIVNHVYKYKKGGTEKPSRVATISTTAQANTKSESPVSNKKEPDHQDIAPAATQPSGLVASSERTSTGLNETAGATVVTNTSTTTNGRIVRQVQETGVAAWIMDGDLNQHKYYALHRSAPVGTIIKVTNRMNGRYVFVKVVGLMPDTGDNQNLIIKISQAASNKINVLDSRFQAELSYGVAE